MGIFSKQRRKLIAPVTLVLWLFAVFVSIANACGFDQAIAGPGVANAAGLAASMTDDPASPACEQFCADDFPVQAKVKAIQDPPSGEALPAMAFTDPSPQSRAAPPTSWLPCPDLPSGADVTILFLRLAL